MSHSDDLLISCIALAICIGLAILGFKQNFKEKTEFKRVRPPWMIIALAAISVGFMVLVHIANLFGFETGGRF
jgi:cytochrome b subunit of formate dehydrogenase